MANNRIHRGCFRFGDDDTHDETGPEGLLKPGVGEGVLPLSKRFGRLYAGIGDFFTPQAKLPNPKINIVMTVLKKINFMCLPLYRKAGSNAVPNKVETEIQLRAHIVQNSHA